MIDWVIAERIAVLVAGRGDAPPPRVDLVALAEDAQRRVIAYTGLVPGNPLPPPEGVSRRQWVASNIRSTRALIDPVMSQAARRFGALRTGAQITLGLVLSSEVGLLVEPLARDAGCLRERLEVDRRSRAVELAQRAGRALDGRPVLARGCLGQRRLLRRHSLVQVGGFRGLR